MTVTQRKIHKALKRLKYIPKGMDFLSYSGNKIEHFAKKASNSIKVAHPSTIMLELTNHCNLHCITCPREYSFGQEMAMGHMDFEKLKSIVDQVYPYIDSIGLTGLGEPMFYKHLPQALAYIKSKNKGIITSISTNASLPKTASIVNEIKGTIDTIQISIDGVGEGYNQIRKNANFDNFIHNVEQIISITKQSDTDVMFNVVIMKENYKQMMDILHLADKMGVNFVNFTLFNLASVTDIPVEYYEFYQSDAFKNELAKVEEEAKKYPHIEFTSWDYKTKSGFKKCNFPWTHFYFSWDGYLVPCCAKPFPKELNFGNAFEKPVMETINSKEFQDFRKLWYQNITPDFCKKCHFIDLKEFSL